MKRIPLFSAAHCIKAKTFGGTLDPLPPDDVLIYLGAHDLDKRQETGRISRTVSKISTHYDWQQETERFDADIAMIVLKKRVEFNRYINPICLWTSTQDPAESTATVNGWGQSEDRSNYFTSLPKQLEVPIHQNEDCFLHFPKLAVIASRRTICAGFASEKGVCLGDSGHGLIIKHGGISYLRGIVSSTLMSGMGCTITNYAVYTNVLKYHAWIEQIISGSRK